MTTSSFSWALQRLHPACLNFCDAQSSNKHHLLHEPLLKEDEDSPPMILHENSCSLRIFRLLCF